MKANTTKRRADHSDPEASGSRIDHGRVMPASRLSLTLGALVLEVRPSTFGPH